MRPRYRMIVLVTLAALAATAPPPTESSHNMPGQRRTRTPAALKGEKVPLRFSDGTPTGFFAWANDPSKNGDGGKPVAAGFMEMDAQEVITTGSGMRLLFHPGGGMYDDAVEHGQYGHVALDDLKNPPTPRPQNLNGKPAPLTGQRCVVTPTVIPHDMFYKPNADEAGRTGSTYYTYGNPGYDKTKGRGDWTYINWSWVQNGRGPDYPANKTAGGGLVRAVVKRGQLFAACDVPPVVGYSWGPDNKVNGRVTAFYGRTNAGPGDKGSEIYGWLPHSYQKNDDVIVPCVRRAPRFGKPLADAKPSHDPDRLVRMALNLLSEAPSDPARRDDLLKRFASEPDPASRMELLTQLSQMDDAQTVAAMTKLASNEKDEHVREQVRLLLGFMRSGETSKPPLTTQPRRD
jgi:hypothetical protein